MASEAHNNFSFYKDTLHKLHDQILELEETKETDQDEDELMLSSEPMDATNSFILV